MSEGTKHWRTDRRGSNTILECTAILLSIGFTFLALAIAFHRLKMKRTSLAFGVVSAIAIVVILDVLVVHASGASFIFILLCSTVYVVLAALTASALLNKNKKKAMAVAIVASVAMAGAYSAVFVGVYLVPKPISYKVDINANSTNEYLIMVPFLDSSPLGSSLKLESGAYRADIVNANKTPIYSSSKALKILARGNATVSALASDAARCEMSLRANPDGNKGQYWVFCEKENPDQNISLIITASYSFQSTIYEWSSGRGHSESCQFLENGWNNISIRHWQVVS